MHIDCLFIYENIFCRCFPHKGHRFRTSYFFVRCLIQFQLKNEAHFLSEECGSVCLCVCLWGPGPQTLCVSDWVVSSTGLNALETAQRELLRCFCSNLRTKHVPSGSSEDFFLSPDRKHQTVCLKWYNNPSSVWQVSDTWILPQIQLFRFILYVLSCLDLALGYWEKKIQSDRNILSLQQISFSYLCSKSFSLTHTDY